MQSRTRRASPPQYPAAEIHTCLWDDMPQCSAAEPLRFERGEPCSTPPSCSPLDSHLVPSPSSRWSLHSHGRRAALGLWPRASWECVHRFSPGHQQRAGPPEHRFSGTCLRLTLQPVPAHCGALASGAPAMQWRTMRASLQRSRRQMRSRCSAQTSGHSAGELQSARALDASRIRLRGRRELPYPCMLDAGEHQQRPDPWKLTTNLARLVTQFVIAPSDASQSCLSINGLVSAGLRAGHLRRQHHRDAARHGPRKPVLPTRLSRRPRHPPRHFWEAMAHRRHCHWG